MIVIPYQPGLESQMLVNFEGRQFVIQAIEDPHDAKVTFVSFAPNASRQTSYG